MPSTYSTLLRLEEMTTGENDGTWGTKTNTNIELLEAAIDGTASIALSGTTHTLTTANGSADQARARTLYFSGSPGGTATVTVPALSHIYYAINATNQSLILTTGGAYTVTIPSGTTTLVFVDSGGVYTCVRYLVDTTIDASNIGATNAGTGRFSTLTSTGAATFFAITNTGTVTTTDIDGGTIDNVAIGATTASTGRFSTLTTTGAATLASATVSGTLTAAGVAVGTMAQGTRTVSTSAPSGGSNGDIWLVVS